MTKTVPITEEGNGKEVCRLADEVDKRRSQDMINLVERGPLGSGAPELEAVLWENPMYGILEGALETGLWWICTDTKPETADTDDDGLKLLRQCSTRQVTLLPAPRSTHRNRCYGQDHNGRWDTHVNEPLCWENCKCVIFILLSI